jgi:hypothetical protein
LQLEFLRIDAARDVGRQHQQQVNRLGRAGRRRHGQYKENNAPEQATHDSLFPSSLG